MQFIRNFGVANLNEFLFSLQLKKSTFWMEKKFKKERKAIKLLEVKIEIADLNRIEEPVKSGKRNILRFQQNRT